MYVIDHLSVSQINTFSRCEFQWYFRYVEGKKIPPSSALVRGKAVHLGLADIYSSKKTEGIFHTDRVLDIISEYVEHSDEAEEVSWDKPKHKTKDCAVGLVRTYIDNKYPDMINSKDIEQVEEKLTHYLFTDKGEKLKIIGYPDLILTDRVVDFKTTSRKVNKISMDYKSQTAFYTTATDKNTIELQYLINKKVPEVITLYTDIDNEIKAISRNVFIKTYNKIKASLQSGNFLPAGIFHPWACGYCAYGEKGMCPYYLSNTS